MQVPIPSKITAALCLTSSLLVPCTIADVPTTLHHQGRVAVNNVNFDGSGQFKFLLFSDPDANHASGNETAVWKNDDASPANLAEPATAVTLAVAKGLYSLRLGEAPQAGLPASLIPPAGSNLYLRTWFDNGVNGSQQLSPDQQLASVPFALHSASSGGNLSDFTNDVGYLASIAGLDISLLDNDANYLSGSGNVIINGGLAVTGSVAVGLNPTATAPNSAAFGHDNESTGQNAMSWGFNNDATNTSTTAFGANNVVSGRRATSWGNGNTTLGDDATTWGVGTGAESFVETVLGSFDTGYVPVSATAWNTADRLFVIGKGTSDVARADALVMLKNGDTELNGELCVNDDVVASGNFKYKTPKTFILQINASEFARDSAPLASYDAPGDHIFPSVGNQIHNLSAAVHLPKGAVITEVGFYLDAEEGSPSWTLFEAQLRRKPPVPTGFTSMGTVSDSSSPIGGAYTISSISNATVLETHQYSLLVGIRATGTSSNLRFHGANVEYTISTLQP